MKIMVFVGPTLSVSEAQKILNHAIYMPPAKQGDVLSAVYNERPDVIALIDGASIEQERSVWHKEILYALKNRIAVYGASAIGALRAVELEAFGMQGIGQVYHQFSTQALDEDDEVLAQFEQISGGRYIRTSEPMINLRATFQEAVSQGVINDREFRLLVDLTKRLHYPQRTFRQIFAQAAQAGLIPDQVVALEMFVSGHYRDLQQEDAIELLHTLAGLSPKDLSNHGSACGEYGDLFWALFERDRQVKHGNDAIPAYLIGSYAVFNHPAIEAINFRALNRGIALAFAEIFGIRASQKEVERETARFRKQHKLGDQQAFTAWLHQNDLHADDFTRLMRDNARIRKIHKWFVTSRAFRQHTQCLLEELILSNEYPVWKQNAVIREQRLLQHQESVKVVVNTQTTQDLLKDLLQHGKFAWNAPLHDVLAETGMHHDNFRLEAAKEYVLRKHLELVLQNVFGGGN